MSLPEAQSGLLGAPISVIVPAFNAEAHLAQCLDSVIAQQGVQLEILVVDDGSTDSTRLLVNRYQRGVRYLRTARRVGPSAARNLGVQAARHDLLAFFDADDLMAPGRLALQSRLLLSTPAVSCAITDYRNFSSVGESSTSHFDTCTRLRVYIATQHPQDLVIVPSRIARALLTEENFGAACGMMFKRGLYQRLGGFDEALRGGEDFDLLYRAALVESIGVINAVGFARRLHETNATSDLAFMLCEKMRSRDKLARLETDAALRRRLRRAASEYRIGLAERHGRKGETASALQALFAKPHLPMALSYQALRALAWAILGPVKAGLDRGTAKRRGH